MSEADSKTKITTEGMLSCARTKIVYPLARSLARREWR